MYHYVKNKDKIYPYINSISDKDFKKQLQYFISTQGIVSNEKEITNCPNKYLLTFDDGLKDHLKVSKILKSKGLIGIFFISTYPLIKKKFLDVHKIQIIFSKIKAEKILLECDNYFKKNKLKNKDFNFLMSKKQKKIYKFDNNGVRKIKTLLNYEINPKIRKKIINYLERKFKINFDFKKFYLSKTDIIKMHKMGMIIGSHGFSHEVLSQLSLKEQIIQIKNSKKYLEKIIDSKIDYFCYPYGKKFTYNKKIFQLLKNNNYKAAFSAIPKNTYKKDFIYKRFAINRYDTNYFDKK